MNDTHPCSFFSLFWSSLRLDVTDPGLKRPIPIQGGPQRPSAAAGGAFAGLPPRGAGGTAPGRPGAEAPGTRMGRAGLGLGRGAGETKGFLCQCVS